MLSNQNISSINRVLAFCHPNWKTVTLLNDSDEFSCSKLWIFWLYLWRQPTGFLARVIFFLSSYNKSHPSNIGCVTWPGTLECSTGTIYLLTFNSQKGKHSQLSKSFPWLLYMRYRYKPRPVRLIDCSHEEPTIKPPDHIKRQVICTAQRPTNLTAPNVAAIHKKRAKCSRTFHCQIHLHKPHWNPPVTCQILHIKSLAHFSQNSYCRNGRSHGQGQTVRPEFPLHYPFRARARTET